MCRRIFLGVACLLLIHEVQAGCSVVASVPALFGSIASTTVRTTMQQTSTTQAGLTCTKALITLLSTNDHIWVTATSAQAGLVGPTGDVITYQLYADATTTYPINRGVAMDYARSPSINLLGLLGGASNRAPIFMRTVVGSDVAAGLYQEDLTLSWQWDYCPSVSLVGACLTARDTGSFTTTLLVSLTVVNDCTILAPNIAFGIAPVVSSFATISQTVNLGCTKGSSYTVGISDGGFLSGGRRRMQSPAGNYLAYDIFKSASSLRWGVSGSDRRASTTADVNPGAGMGATLQIFNYNARIYTDQTTPAAGAYTDNVTVDVQF